MLEGDRNEEGTEGERRSMSGIMPIILCQRVFQIYLGILDTLKVWLYNFCHHHCAKRSKPKFEKKKNVLLVYISVFSYSDKHKHLFFLLDFFFNLYHPIFYYYGDILIIFLHFF